MSTLRYPTFASHLHVEVLPREGVLLLAEEDVLHLRGQVFRVLAPLLDGSRTVEEIVETASASLSAAEVHYGLGRLEQKGVLVEAAPDEPPAFAAFWHSLGVDPRDARRRLTESAVEVVSLGESSGEPLREALAAEGLRVGRRRSVLKIVLADDYLRAPLEELNREALQTKRPWLLARPTGKALWLGPRFVPGQGACWECLAQRLRANRPLEALVARHRPESGALRPARAALESTARAAAGLIASAVARGLVTGDDGLRDTLVTLELLGFGTRRHLVVRRPQCPACGEPGRVAASQSRPLVLERRPKVFTSDGGHRQEDPEHTVRRHEHHVSPITGLVQHLQADEALPSDVAPLFDAGPNRAAGARRLAALRGLYRLRSYGKGRTVAQARASALCEALERACGVFHGDEARRRATFEALGPEAISPADCLLYSERQYGERESSSEDLQEVPHRFDPSRRISWSPAWSLTHGARRYLATAFCYYGFQDPGVPPFVFSDSNGCAAGNSLEEAILQGFLELVERDAVALWWYNRLRRPGVAFDGFGEPYLQRLAEYYRSRGRELWALDLTSDLGIPVFAAVSRRVEGTPEALLLGFGAHLEPRIALLRAVTELNQLLPSERGLEQARPEDSSAWRWLLEARLADHSYLSPDTRRPARTASSFPRLWGEDLRDDVETCVRLARERGLETVVLDQTRPDVGLTVVKVVVPGMRHFWRRLGPGRLYDVPVREGWLKRPTPEARLNPIEMFL
jgi:ribosomal protein S12 methylthiotransferase accessory factor